ncbi:hypothetical protein PoB_002793500 [Plakobranchus ocellatus]|uniref:Uncharacterized protein n=1 Tax=Plakobranchus ocellatus TaxID=259542 RepID=A0AAV4A1Z5_9GAST|nr:hypothetical protein PoB_002793500 [Plakobranchus ocellatus]
MSLAFRSPLLFPTVVPRGIHQAALPPTRRPLASGESTRLGAQRKDSSWGVNVSSQQGDLRRSVQGGEARTCDRRASADLRADSLATVPPTPR